jgi:hypothetical protein
LRDELKAAKIQIATLKVDYIEYKNKVKNLEETLKMEMNQSREELRRIQNEKMDTTVINERRRNRSRRHQTKDSHCQRPSTSAKQVK